MKKLLVLALVMGVAGFASAGYYYTMTGAPSDAQLGDTLSIAVLAGDAGVSAFNNAVMTISGGTVTGAALADVYQEGITPSISFTAGSVTLADTVVPGDGIGAGTELFSFTVSADAVGTLTIDATGGNWSELPVATGPDDGYYSYGAEYGLPYAEVNVTPEPATLALLGLGALVLRRKK